MKALGETSAWQPWHYEAVRNFPANADAFVRSRCRRALSMHPAAENLTPLLSLLNATDPQAAQLNHQARIAIRNQISSPAFASALSDLQLSVTEREQLVAFVVTAPRGPLPS